MAMSAKDKRALTLCGCFLGVVGLYMGIIDPLVLRYDAAREKIATQEKKLRGLRRQKKLLRPRQRKLRVTRAEVDGLLSTYATKTPKEQRLSGCIRDFQRAAATSGAVLHSIRPLPPTDEVDPNFDSYRFELDFSGSYATVQRMLYRLEAGPILHLTRQMDLRADKDGLKCRLLAERFYVREAEVAARATGPDVVLQIALDDWIGFGAVYIADKLGYLKSGRVRVTLVRPKAASLAEALKRGEVDAISLGLQPLLQISAKTTDWRVAMGLSYGKGFEGVVGCKRLGVNRIQDLQGKTVAVETRSTCYYLLARALQSQGVAGNTIKLQQMAPPEAATAVVQGKVAAAALTDPYLAGAMDTGRVALLFDSSAVKGEFLDLLVTTEEVLQTKMEAFRVLREGVSRAIAWWQQNPGEGNTLVATRLDVDPGDVASLAKKVALLGERENRTDLQLQKNAESPLFEWAEHHRVFLEATGCGPIPKEAYQRWISPSVVSLWEKTGGD